MFVHISMYHMHVDAYRDQKRASETLELQLQAIVSTIYVLESELGSSARATSTLNC